MTEMTPQRTPTPSGWALSGLVFAGAVLTLVGLFSIVTGLVALIDDEFYVVGANYTFELDTTAWGWIHLIMGLLLTVTGFGLFSRSSWAAMTAIVLAMLSALANFFFIPFYPFWSLLIIALNIWVIWALTREGVAEG